MILDMLFRAFIAVAVVAWSAGAGAGIGTAQDLQMGIATADITPPIGYRMSGYFYERPSTGTNDALQVKTLVLRQGDAAIGLAICDLIGISPSVSAAARKEASRRTGIPGEHFIVAATHTHTGPLYDGELRDHLHEVAIKASANGRDPRETVDYPTQLAERIAESFEKAAKNLRPVRLATGATKPSQTLSFNRRFHMKDGTVQFNPGKKNPNKVRAAGPIDPEIGLLAFRDAAGKNLAALTVFALHLDTMGGTLYGADYPYYLERSLRAELGGDFTSFFGTGTCGDINHIDTDNEQPQKGGSETQRIGEKLGEAVLAELPNLKASSAPRLAIRSAIVRVPWQRFSPADLERAQADIFKVGQRKLPFLEEVRICTILDLHSRGPEPGALEVQAVRFDDETALVSLPGEVFVELGLAIKRASPFARTMVMELCNDSPAYVPTKKAFAEGSYEIVNSRIEPGGGETLVTKAIELLKELKGERSPSEAPSKTKTNP